MQLQTGTYISGVAHGGLIFWVLVGGLFLRAGDPLPVQTTDVSLLTGEEFAALTAPQPSPIQPVQEPAVVQPDLPQDSPAISAQTDETVETSTPDAVAEPEKDPNPQQPTIVPQQPDEVTETAPDVLAPPVQDIATDLAPPSDAPPKATAAPRIAPTPAPETAPDTEIADTVSPQTAPDQNADSQVADKPATAPQQAAPEIVTEAEKPSAAPPRSLRPPSRPKKPTVALAKPQPAAPKENAIDDAVAAVVAETSTATAAAPSGPPLTAGEKDALRVSVSNCWNLGSSSSEALSTTVVVMVDMSREGRPTAIKLQSSDGPSENATRIAFDAARRAVIRCGASGYKLPSDKYSQWQNIEMTFNPERMRIK